MNNNINVNRRNNRHSSNTRRRNRRHIRINWSNIFTVFVAFVFIWCIAGLVNPEVEAIDYLKNEDGVIRYEYVNFRQEPSISADVICEIFQGEDVVYTGNRIEYLLNEVNSAWVEIEYNGITGWIVSEAVTTSGYGY